MPELIGIVLFILPLIVVIYIGYRLLFNLEKSITGNTENLRDSGSLKSRWEAEREKRDARTGSKIREAKFIVWSVWEDSMSLDSWMEAQSYMKGELKRRGEAATSFQSPQEARAYVKAALKEQDLEEIG